MSPEVIKVLSLKDEPKELSDFRMRLQDLVRMSRNTMKNYYPMWDSNDRVYRGERAPDESDKKAMKRNEPGKVFVPMTHTQIQTFVSFATMLLTQRDYFFEMEGSGTEDVKPAKIAQAVLQRDLEYNKFEGVLLPQFLTDVSRFGLAIFKSQWGRDTTPVKQQVPDPKWQPNPNLPTQSVPPMISKWGVKTKYLGNKIEVTSPYRWFPDTRLPLTRYRDGEFCADETEHSITELKGLERQGECAGIEHIPRIPDDAFNDRRMNGMDRETNARFDPTINPKDSAHFVLITEVELRCNPSMVEIAPGVMLDPELDADVVVCVWIANDGRIVRITDSGYEHNEFLYDAAQYFNDQNRLVNFGIAELLGPMQDIIDWLMNSRVSNVRKVVNNQLVVDPKNIEMDDLKNRNPVIRLKSTVPEGMSIDMFVKQLQVTDVTTGHITDMGIVEQFGQQATGLQDNLMGAYSSGRRSAREASNVNANGAGRVITPIKGLWQSAILPLGRKMLSNSQQGLDEEQLVRIIGLQRFIVDSQPDPMNPYLPSPVQSFIPVDRSQIVGNYNFLVFEGTLPSQRTAIAAALAQAGDIIIKNPQAALALQLDPKLLFDEWLELMGVHNAERFRLTPQRLAEIIGVATAARNGGTPGGPPPAGGGSPPQR